MNKNVKRTVATMMIAGMTVSGAAGVYAGTNMEKISAFLNHSIGFKINGSTYIPKDENGNKLSPITYHDTTYLPVRALSNALNTPIQYDSKTNTIYIGTSTTDQWVLTNYTAAQLDEIKQAFAGFDGFETAYAPQIMIKGDALQKVAATADGVNLLFKNMTVNVSPRDYSHDYDGTAVTLPNGLTGKWYKPGDTAMLSVKVDDRYVTVSSPDGKLSNSQLEKVATTVTKVGAVQTDLVQVVYTAAQLDELKKAFAGFDGFETAYAPQMMIKGDVLQKTVATADGVNIVFENMTVNVSPRDYSHDYDGKSVTLSNGAKAKWYKVGDTPMLTLKVDDRYVTLSSPNANLTQARLEKVAVTVAKVGAVQSDLAKVTYTSAQSNAIKDEFAKFDGFTTAYAPTLMIKDDAFQKVAGGDSVNFFFKHMNVKISPRDYSVGYDSTNVTLPNGVKAKWFTPSDTATLSFQIDDRYVTISSADKSLTKAQVEQIATGVAKLK
ncbi:copper amine oxidase N-terminal domain-containing protein [Paenibacillus glycanilyticus]|uniref:copper amine oxidase N-terminal domain-containing protein n=1 Tax=Paenibacillus glycanilyticus TaxID=126569 RepID=UPI00203D77EC|nr:copper amine oxidase N-terminal domain-containing protein [Paenibacillus glycanilyticus]MCM3629371.1 copper amine oxidase N-terminal domain-containing protein [Paenibacillus glycanilyticus]